MAVKYPQGRIQVFQKSAAGMEWSFSWPCDLKLLEMDEELLLNWTVIWHYLDEKKVENTQWNIEALKVLTGIWLTIPANFMMDRTVKKKSLQMLANLIAQFWLNRMDIQIIRSFSATLKKAAADIETSIIGGFLKLAVTRKTALPEIVQFNGEKRKVSSQHYSCTISVFYRSKASSLDMENYLMAKNNALDEVSMNLF